MEKQECIDLALKIFNESGEKFEFREPIYEYSHTILFYSAKINVSAKIEFLDKNVHITLEKHDNEEVNLHISYDATFGTKVYYFIEIIKKYRKINKMCKVLVNNEIPRKFIIKTLL